MSNDSEHVEEQSNKKNNVGDNEDNDDPRETSSMRHFLNQVGESQREALEKIFDSSIDNSCLPSCENQLENQMDLLMHCRQPLSFLPYFQQRENMYASCDVEPVGAYVAPRSCEYCGASTTTLCPSSCQRPRLYFRKQKPPFASSDGWDPLTEYELPPVVEDDMKQQPPKRRTSWVSGLFGQTTS